jgi:hypothetical protein
MAWFVQLNRRFILVLIVLSRVYCASLFWVSIKILMLFHEDKQLVFTPRWIHLADYWRLLILWRKYLDLCRLQWKIVKKLTHHNQ